MTDFQVYTIDVEDLSDFGGKYFLQQEESLCAGSSSASFDSLELLMKCGHPFWFRQGNVSQELFTPSYSLATTLDPKFLSPLNVVHGPDSDLGTLWVYDRGCYDKYNLPEDEWVKVIGMLPRGLRYDGAGPPMNYLFIVEGSNIPSSSDTGCDFACIKNPSLQGEFVSLGKKKVVHQKADQPACGLSVSASKDTGELNTCVLISFCDDLSSQIMISRAW